MQGGENEFRLTCEPSSPVEARDKSSGRHASRALGPVCPETSDESFRGIWEPRVAEPTRSGVSGATRGRVHSQQSH